ncbi:hypothetical protein HK100_010221 [Physocladia obscura]|uniref:Ciliary microtubule inner protein 2A-C-like domain-containing protein n=1 Tax=Physocladia obscura TaxID=109957 RepID=A0AAD5XES9_9FUNG|nr:hypothetical protein HK100_010221 [Physocladia obscura]
MTLEEETTCIATPGFAGFVPSLKYQFGLTYGNATRHILHTDPSLKQGEIQKAITARREQFLAEKNSASAKKSSNEKEYIWKRENKYATGDDRFSFPPVPGYTGYIPRSQEHFGRPYVETTNASLADFESMLKSRNELPPRVQAIKDKQKPTISDKSTKHAAVSNYPQKTNFAYASTVTSLTNDKSPYKLPVNHPEKTYISGYTGFVPRLQNHFGEPYSDSVRKAIDEFTAPKSTRDPYKEPYRETKTKSISKTQPIPGFTGFIPGSKYGFATTFGKTTEIAYENFNNRDERGRIVGGQSTKLPAKQLAKSMPIPGYRGHIPNYIFAAERSYGQVNDSDSEQE